MTLDDARELFGYEPIVVSDDSDFDAWDDSSDDYPHATATPTERGI